MAKGIAFDTLAHAEFLEQAGIAQANVHSAALANALAQNTYTRFEADNMIEAALKRFDERTLQIKEEMRQMRLELRLEMKELELKMKEIEKDFAKRIEQITNTVVHRLTINIGIIVALLSVIGTLLHFGTR